MYVKMQCLHADNAHAAWPKKLEGSLKGVGGRVKRLQQLVDADPASFKPLVSCVSDYYKQAVCIHKNTPLCHMHININILCGVLYMSGVTH